VQACSFSIPSAAGRFPTDTENVNPQLPLPNPQSAIRNPQSAIPWIRNPQSAIPWIRNPQSRGAVLIVTLWVIVVLSCMVMALAVSMRVEAACSANYAAVQRAFGVEQGAIQYVLACVDGLNGAVPTDSNTPCNGVIVGNGMFWIIRPNFDNDRRIAYGIVDEASKVNISTANQDMLTMLPRMMREDAAAIIDWRDSDENITLGGAESEFYLAMPDPYRCKNSPFETVEELLLVRGMLPELLYGEDMNRNGILDDNENDGDQSDPPDNADGKLDRGLYDMVTVYSSEGTAAGSGGTSGSQPVDVNSASSDQLRQTFRDYISGNRLEEVVARTRTMRPFKNVLDFYFRAQLTYDEFKGIAGKITANASSSSGGGRSGGSSASSVKRGLININTAPRDVLLCLPGIGDPEANALIQRRAGRITDEGIAWVVQALPQEKAVPIGSLITSRAYQFSADIVSVSGDGRAFRRCRIVVDARQSPPRVIYRRDLTSLGWPLDPMILDALRAGVGMENVIESTTGLEVRQNVVKT
jgi:type II secretory pathway component PulK